MLDSGTVVVITGASDGIGKATAKELAKQNTNLVLLARSEQKLRETAIECERLGADCFYLSVDTGDAEAVQQAADKAVERFGRIDVWINNAGVASFGTFYDVPLAEHHRVIQTNVIGYMNGSYSALKQFKKQKRGTLINNASICARLSTPKMSSYIASKFAIRGLTHSIRQDLVVDGLKDVHVCLMNPALVDTKVFDHAHNYNGRKPALHMPMTTPENVATAIVRLIEKPKREAFVGPLAKLGVFGYTLFPSLTGFILTWMTNYFMFGESKETLRKKWLS
jgi:short-subunit dehydrogenase